MARQDHSHRAPRLPRAPRCRGAERGARVARAAHRRAARARAAHPRLPQGQGARPDGDPAHRPRGGARAGGARLAARVVRGGDRALRASRRSATRSSTWTTCRSSGEPLSFSIEVGVTPKATLGEYSDLEVGKRSPEVPDEAIQTELDRLRESFARLESVDRRGPAGRPPGDGLRRPRGRRASSRAARRATTCSRSAAGG